MKKRKKRNDTESDRGYFLQNILIMALLICVLALGVRLAEHSAGPSAFEKAVLEYVVDGDTLNVTVGGESVRVRLIGIDTPESVSRTEENTPQGQEASDYLHGLLARGDELYLEYDERRYDDYGRTLAYVWLSPDADTESYEEFCRYNLSAVIYQNTFCELITIPPNTKYYDWFEELTPWEES